MKTQLLMVELLFIVITIGLSGCTQQKSSEDSSSDHLSDQTPPPATESIQTILAKADRIESMYYEIAASINMSECGTQTALIQIWQKTPYVKEQVTGVVDGITTTMSMIQRPDGTYIYDTAQGKYVLKTRTNPITTPFITSLQYLNIQQIKDFVNNESVINLETATVDGKTASVIQYTSPIGENIITMKMWIWNEKGVPLKAYIDMTMEKTTMVMDFEYSNYSFSDIPDSTFSVS
jgi:outer membrane lipoprotein-sorting protein